MRMNVVTDALRLCQYYSSGKEVKEGRRGKEGKRGTYTHHKLNTPITLNFVLRFNCSLATIAKGTKQSAKSTPHVIAL